MDDILELLTRKAVFHCRPRGGGFRKRDIDVFHTCERLPDSTEIPDWLPLSMHSVLNNIGTTVLFHPEVGPDEGFRLFSPGECAAQLLTFRKLMTGARQLTDCNDPEISDEIKAWIDGLCPIAEVMRSGDYFALDTESAKENDECPIVYLDHEYYFSGSLDIEDVEVVASDVIALVRAVLVDPLKFLDSHWTGGDPYDQWFPESVTFSN